jgi:hypothetical protein
VTVALLVCLAAAAGFGRQFNGGNPNNPNPSVLGQTDRLHLPDEEPYATREIQARQLKRLREEHQKQVFSDTARLLELATSLKAEVDKGNAPTTDVIKDADEIGKLAKRVSDRIKTQ